MLQCLSQIGRPCTTSYKRKALIISVIALFFMAYIMSNAVMDKLTVNNDNTMLHESRIFSPKAAVNTTSRSQEDGFKEYANTGEKRHIVFVKTHKTASSTMLNMLIRFSVSRDLNVFFPREGHIINQGGTQIRKSNIVSLPVGQNFDILCSHLIFDRQEIAPYFPKSTVYITIVREPFKQFVSAFKYYYLIYPQPHIVKAVKGNPIDPIGGFLKNPSKYDRISPRKSYTNNRMSIDLGFPVNRFEADKRNESLIAEFLSQLKSTFELILIADYFDESMVLLRRRLSWQVKDILYMPINVLKAGTKSRSTWLDVKDYEPEMKKLFAKWGNVDVKLYELVLSMFSKEIKKEGHNFPKEVASFKRLRRSVEEYCHSRNTATRNLTFEQSEWSPSFNVTEHDCKLMLMNEAQILNYGRKRQYRRHHCLYPPKKHERSFPAISCPTSSISV